MNHNDFEWLKEKCITFDIEFEDTTPKDSDSFPLGITVRSAKINGKPFKFPDIAALYVDKLLKERDEDEEEEEEAEE